MMQWRRETPMMATVADPLVALVDQHVTAAGRFGDTLTRVHAILVEGDIPDDLCRSIVLRQVDEALLIERRAARSVVSPAMGKRPLMKPAAPAAQSAPAPRPLAWLLMALILACVATLSALFAVMVHALVPSIGFLPVFVVTLVVSCAGLVMLLMAMYRLMTAQSNAKGGK